jgi:hypothetical protein
LVPELKPSELLDKVMSIKRSGNPKSDIEWLKSGCFNETGARGWREEGGGEALGSLLGPTDAC